MMTSRSVSAGQDAGTQESGSGCSEGGDVSALSAKYSALTTFPIRHPARYPDNMNEKAKGDLYLALAIITLIIGLGFTGFSLFVDMPRKNALREHGMVVDGFVTDKHQETRRSRRSSSTNFYVGVAYATKDAIPYAQATEAPKKKKTVDEILNGLTIKRNTGADQQASLNISGRLYQQLSLGSSVKVIFVPEEKDEAYLFEDVRDYSPWSMTSAGLLFCAIAAAVAVYAQKKRKQAA